MMQRDDVRRLIGKHFAVLNRLESHLGCVICRGPFTSDGQRWRSRLRRNPND